MLKKLTIIALLVLLINVNTARAVVGVDLSQPANSFSCLKSNGYQFAIARAYMSYGAVDTNAIQTLKNAKAAGLITDIYHFPCIGKVAAATQAQAVMSSMVDGGHDLYGTVWIDVESNSSSGCGWTSDINYNCSFLNQIVQTYKAQGKLVGIYASKYQWQSIFGAPGNCAWFTTLPVWYAHYDSSPSFSDWSSSSFGGWSKPSIKQYQGTTTVCGTGVDLNYY